MAVDKTKIPRGFHSFELATSGTTNVLTRIDLPAWCGVVVLRPRANEAKLAHEGADGVAIGTIDYSTLPADTTREVILRRGPSRPEVWPASIYVTAATVSTEIEVELEPYGAV